jgi:hypothetical protein
MNQRADSLKKNLRIIVAKPLINQSSGLLSHTMRFLSHTMRCSRDEKRIAKAFERAIERFFGRKRRIPRVLPVRVSAISPLLPENGCAFANKPSPDGGERLPSNKAERTHSRPTRHSPMCIWARVGAQFTGFLGLGGLALTGFAGLMLRGRPAVADEISGSGSGLKNTRQPGVSCDLFLTMQAVTRSTSGTSALQSLKASSLQACCCSGV